MMKTWETWSVKWQIFKPRLMKHEDMRLKRRNPSAKLLQHLFASAILHKRNKILLRWQGVVGRVKILTRRGIHEYNKRFWSFRGNKQMSRKRLASMTISLNLQKYSHHSQRIIRLWSIKRGGNSRLVSCTLLMQRMMFWRWEWQNSWDS